MINEKNQANVSQSVVDMGFTKDQFADGEGRTQKDMFGLTGRLKNGVVNRNEPQNTNIHRMSDLGW